MPLHAMQSRGILLPHAHRKRRHMHHLLTDSRNQARNISALEPRGGRIIQDQGLQAIQTATGVDPNQITAGALNQIPHHPITGATNPLLQEATHLQTQILPDLIITQHLPGQEAITAIPRLLNQAEAIIIPRLHVQVVAAAAVAEVIPVDLEEAVGEDNLNFNLKEYEDH